MSDTAELRTLFADWERGDFTGAIALLSPDVRFSGAQPEGQVEARGPDGVRRFMRRFLEDWHRYTIELHELEELGGGRYLATGTQRGKGKGSAVDITAPMHAAIRMHAGEITQLELFLDREDALGALG